MVLSLTEAGFYLYGTVVTILGITIAVLYVDARMMLKRWVSDDIERTSERGKKRRVLIGEAEELLPWLTSSDPGDVAKAETRIRVILAELRNL